MLSRNSSCPYCGKDIKLPDRAIHNVDTYRRPVRARTKCCGKVVLVSVSNLFTYSQTDQTHKDDWGE